MKRNAFFVTALLLVFGSLIPIGSSAQVSGANRAGSVVADQPPFPFRSYVDDNDEYDLFIDLSAPEVKRMYKAIFKKHELPYNGASFEEVVLHALASDPALETVVITSASDNKLLIGTGNPIYRKNLIKLLVPILRNEPSFDKFMSSLQEEE